MWHKTYSTETNEVSGLQVWTVLTNINKWGDWDDEIEWMELKGECKINAEFYLKPKGGPKTKLTVTQFEKPAIFADVAHLPLAKMHTIHTLKQSPTGLTIQVDIKITGLLAFLWSRVIGQKQIDGGEAQNRRLIAKAKTV